MVTKRIVGKSDFAIAAGLAVPPSWSAITPEVISALLQDQWERRESLRATLAPRAQRFIEDARRNITRVREVITGTG